MVSPDPGPSAWRAQSRELFDLHIAVDFGWEHNHES
jgi:hypothetical protein